LQSAKQWTEGVIRAATLEDVDLVNELFNARSQAMFGENQATREETLAQWKGPRTDLSLDSRVALDRDGRAVGWGFVNSPRDPYLTIWCGVTLHPENAGDEALWDVLQAWAIGRASDFADKAEAGKRVTLHSSALAQDDARLGSLERAGYVRVRVNNRMRIDFSDVPVGPAVWPQGITARAADLDKDLKGIVGADIEAFRDHWGHVETPFSEELDGWREFIAELGDGLDPSLWFLAMDGDEIAGIAVCAARIADDMTRGYIESLAVRPAWRKRGIGLALLRHAFGEFQRRSYVAIELDMDSENLTGALRLYEKAGMRVIRQMIQFERELRPGIDLVRRSLDS